MTNKIKTADFSQLTLSNPGKHASRQQNTKMETVFEAIFAQQSIESTLPLHIRRREVSTSNAVNFIDISPCALNAKVPAVYYTCTVS